MERATMIFCALLIVAGQAGSAWWVTKHTGSYAGPYDYATDRSIAQLSEQTKDVESALWKIDSDLLKIDLERLDERRLDRYK